MKLDLFLYKYSNPVVYIDQFVQLLTKLLKLPTETFCLRNDMKATRQIWNVCEAQHKWKMRSHAIIPIHPYTYTTALFRKEKVLINLCCLLRAHNNYLPSIFRYLCCPPVAILWSCDFVAVVSFIVCFVIWKDFCLHLWISGFPA